MAGSAPTTLVQRKRFGNAGKPQPERAWITSRRINTKKLGAFLKSLKSHNSFLWHQLTASGASPSIGNWYPCGGPVPMFKKGAKI